MCMNITIVSCYVLYISLRQIPRNFEHLSESFCNSTAITQNRVNRDIRLSN